MRRLIAPCTCVLALVTGVWAGQAFTFFAPLDPVGTENTASASVAATAWRFYDAIDLLIRTGDDAALRAVVAPGFVDHIEFPGSLANRDGLLEYLASVRTTYPTLRIVPEDVIAQGDRTIARITRPRDGVGAIMGIPLRGSPPWPETEIVRVEGGLVAERWGGPAGYALSRLGFSEAMTAPLRGAVLPYLRRITVAPGVDDAALDWLYPAIVTVEFGELTVSTGDSGGDGRAALPGVLKLGDTLVVDERMDIAVGNRTNAPVAFLLLSLGQPTQAPSSGLDTGLIETAPGVGVRGLAGYGTVERFTPAAGLTVDLAEVTLSPGMKLSTHQVDVAELVVVVSGTLTAAIAGEPVSAWLRDPGGHASVPDSHTEVSHGFGLSVSGVGASTSYHNESSHPATFLLVVLSSQ